METFFSHVLQDRRQRVPGFETMAASKQIVCGKKRSKICKPLRSICCLRWRDCSSMRSYVGARGTSTPNISIKEWFRTGFNCKKSPARIWHKMFPNVSCPAAKASSASRLLRVFLFPSARGAGMDPPTGTEPLEHEFKRDCLPQCAASSKTQRRRRQ